MNHLILETPAAPVRNEQQTIQQMYWWIKLAQQTSQKLVSLQEQAQQIQPRVDVLNQETQRLEASILGNEESKADNLPPVEPLCVTTADRLTQVAQETVELTRPSAQRSRQIVSLSFKSLEQLRALKSLA